MDPASQIVGAEKLTGVLGYWPTFHDAEVIWVRLDRGGAGAGPSLEALVHTFEMTNQVDAAGFYVLRNNVLVHLRFAGVSDLKLDDFNEQNVLFGLTISKREGAAAESGFDVKFDPSWGVGAVFGCTAVAVVSVDPCDSSGRSLTTGKI